jgi:hypothetical protein
MHDCPHVLRLDKHDCATLQLLVASPASLASLAPESLALPSPRNLSKSWVHAHKSAQNAMDASRTRPTPEAYRAHFR